MDILNLILIICVIIITYFFVKNFFFQNKAQAKPAKQKKEELIDDYITQMQEVITLYMHDEEALKREKTQLLKQISQELATNIFFDKQEVRDLLYKLANMH